MEKALSIKGLPPEERPRERLYHVGAQDLSLQELLAVLFGRGSKDASALVLAFRLLETFGDLVSLGRASLDDPTAVAFDLSQPRAPGQWLILSNNTRQALHTQSEYLQYVMCRSALFKLGNHWRVV